ncbi:MAG: hypothetical protein ACO4CZ_09195, partial [Planctomycetota bacterium]
MLARWIILASTAVLAACGTTRAPDRPVLECAVQPEALASEPLGTSGDAGLNRPAAGSDGGVLAAGREPGGLERRLHVVEAELAEVEQRGGQ